MKYLVLIRHIGCILLGIIAFNLVSYSIHGEFEFPGPTIVGVLVGLSISSLWNFLLKYRSELRMEIRHKTTIIEEQILGSERLSLATQHAPIWDWNLETGELFISPSLAGGLGYTEEEFAHETSEAFSRIVHPDDREEYKTRLEKHLAAPQSAFMSEHRLRSKSGEYRWFFAIGNSKVDAKGIVVRFSGTTTDVTERVKLERQLHQAQKMEAIGQLTGGMAHDFNNILAVILGNLELIKEIKDPNEFEVLADAGINAAQKGADLISNMLSFSRKARMQRVIFSLNDMVRETRKWSAIGVPEHISIVLSLSEQLRLVEADFSMAQSALLNLVLNSRDAMPDGGTLTIHTSNAYFDENVITGTGETFPEGHYVLLKVSDTGSGISSEDLARIFDPFFTTKPPWEGSGLGLSMVQGFIHQSGGFIEVFSEPIGTTFKLYFPALLDGISKQAAAAPSVVEPPQENTHILLVEDKEELLNVIFKSLTRAGYRVSVAHSGDEAAALWQMDDDFDLLLTDVVMPGKLQGPDLARQIRQSAPDLPVIFMSGYEPDANAYANDQNPQDIRLMKPVSKHDLLESISTSLTASQIKPCPETNE